jgi:hypothetical protein
VIVYRSEHSTQSNPTTILDLRRALYEHLGVQCGFGCEVAERVDAADASQSKPEGGPVETDPARRP